MLDSSFCLVVGLHPASKVIESETKCSSWRNVRKSVKLQVKLGDSHVAQGGYQSTKQAADEESNDECLKIK